MCFGPLDLHIHLADNKYVPPILYIGVENQSLISVPRTSCVDNHFSAVSLYLALFDKMFIADCSAFLIPCFESNTFRSVGNFTFRRESLISSYSLWISAAFSLLMGPKIPLLSTCGVVGCPPKALQCCVYNSRTKNLSKKYSRILYQIWLKFSGMIIPDLVCLYNYIRYQNYTWNGTEIFKWASKSGIIEIWLKENLV